MSLPLLKALEEYLQEQEHNQTEIDETSITKTKSTKHKRAIHIVVGPEGGWSLEEIQQIHHLQSTHSNYVKSVTLGSTVLRAETAAIAAVAAIVLHQESHK